MGHIARALTLGMVLSVWNAPPAKAEAAVDPSSSLPPVISLQRALEIFRLRGFDLLVAEATVRSAEGDLIIAGGIANPTVSGSVGKNFLCSSSQDCHTLSWSVGLDDNAALSTWLSGKLGLRKDFAAAALDAARRSRDDAQRMLELQVKQAYIAALLSDALVQNAQETAESYQRTRDLNERRLTLGAIHEGDFARTQVAYLEAEQALDQAKVGLDTAKVALAFLLGVRTLVPNFRVDSTEMNFLVPGGLEGAGLQSLADEALKRRPDLRAQAEQEKRAQAGLSLAKRNIFPDISLSLTYSANGTGESNISPPNASIGLLLPLPIFYFQRGEIEKAQADVDTQHVLREKAEAQVVADTQTAWSQLGAARKLVERMQASLLDAALKARDITRIQYEKGGASLLDLLDAQRTYTATRVEYAQDLAGYWGAVAQLEAAVALELRR